MTKQFKNLNNQLLPFDEWVKTIEPGMPIDHTTYLNEQTRIRKVLKSAISSNLSASQPLTVDSTNPKDLIGCKKPSLSLIPPVANVLEALVMKIGATKYGAYNWRSKKVQTMIYLDAILRHLSAYLDGEDNDRETGVSHIASIRANTGILLDAQANGNLIDNRPSKGKANEALNEKK